MDSYLFGRAIGLVVLVALLVCGFKRISFWIVAVAVAVLSAGMVAFMSMDVTTGGIVLAANLLWYGAARLARWGWDKLTDA